MFFYLSLIFFFSQYRLKKIQEKKKANKSIKAKELLQYQTDNDRTGFYTTEVNFVYDVIFLVVHQNDICSFRITIAMEFLICAYFLLRHFFVANKNMTKLQQFLDF